MKKNQLNRPSKRVASPSARFEFIDAMRGLAALWVVFFHAQQGQHIEQLIYVLPSWLTTVLFEWGHLGVPMFFVLSGFVMAHSLRTMQATRSNFGRFALRRSVRLDPPYWGSILFVVGYHTLSSVVQSEPVNLPTWQTLVAHVFYLQEFLQTEEISMIYWTLCQEIQFYLIFWLLLALVQMLESRVRWAKQAVFGGAAICSLLWPFGLVSAGFIPGIFLPFFHAFLLGVFAYWSWKKQGSTKAFFAMAIMLLIAGWTQHRDFTFASALFSIVIYGLSQTNKSLSFFSNFVLQHLGRISYSLYLTHTPILGASFFILHKVFGNYGFSTQTAGSDLLILLFAISATIGFATLFWWLIERPALQFSKHVQKTQPTSSESRGITRWNEARAESKL